MLRNESTTCVARFSTLLKRTLFTCSTVPLVVPCITLVDLVGWHTSTFLFYKALSLEETTIGFIGAVESPLFLTKTWGLVLTASHEGNVAQ